MKTIKIQGFTMKEGDCYEAEDRGERKFFFITKIKDGKADGPYSGSTIKEAHENKKKYDEFDQKNAFELNHTYTDYFDSFPRIKIIRKVQKERVNLELL